METEKRVLDPETLKKLAEAGALGFTDNPEFPYVLESVRKKDDSGEYIVPKEYWPIFTLKGKDGVEGAKIEDDMGYMEIDDKSGKKRWIGKSGSKRILLLKDGVIGWKNWFNKDGVEIVFRHNNGKIHRDSLAAITPDIGIELVNAITDRTSLTPEELEGLEY